jgi:hypothetical protein
MHVELDGVRTNATFLSSTAVTAITAPHGEGVVDVVVTNLLGQRATLTRGYTYAVIQAGPRPEIASVAPNVGTTRGGGFLRISGAGFERGASIRFGATLVKLYPFNSNSTTLNAQAPSHSPGSVDVVVQNPDGQTTTLTRGYTYAAPGSLDFNGEWKGEADDRTDSHRGTQVAFTIRNNTLVSISCNADRRELPAVQPVLDDAFSGSVDGVLMTAMFLSATEARGRIEFGRCGPGWHATRR